MYSEGLSKNLTEAGTIKQRKMDVESTKRKLFYFSYPIGAKVKNFNFFRASSYGLVDQYGSPVEPIYDHCTTEIEEDVSVMDFVADQFFSMKRRYEELSNQNGIYGTLTPVRAISENTKIDVMYEEHLDTVMDAYVTHIYQAKNSKIDTFANFCKEFLSFISSTRTASLAGGVPITKSSFVNSSNVNFLSSGLVIDFQDSDFDDAGKIFRGWMQDSNFSLYCDAANKAGFFIDEDHPFRLVADIASKKMQRSAEFYGADYRPGGAGSIFEEFYLKCGRYDFLILKNKLLLSYVEFVENNPIIYHEKPCRNRVMVHKQDREKLVLKELSLPPIPSRSKAPQDDASNYLLGSSNVNKNIAYGMHHEKYDLIYFTILYVEIKFAEIQDTALYLTNNEKDAILKGALKHIVKGNIRAGYDHISRHFDAYRLVPH